MDYKRKTKNQNNRQGNEVLEKTNKTRRDKISVARVIKMVDTHPKNGREILL